MALTTELHADLVPYLTVSKFFGSTVDHPLVRNIPLNSDCSSHPEFKDGTAFVNGIYLEKLKHLEKARLEKNWGGSVFCHERPYRLEALRTLDQQYQLSGRKFWPLVSHIWTDSGNISQNSDEWLEVWNDERDCRQSVMIAAERKALAAMPDEIGVWHGGGPKAESDNALGMSWSTNRNVAMWFAHTHNKTPYLASGIVRKTDVLAYLTGRNEAEIVVFPDRIRSRKITRLKHIGREELASLREFMSQEN